MCKCFEEVPNNVKNNLIANGVDVNGLPYIPYHNYFAGDFYYNGIAIDMVYFKWHTKRNGDKVSKKVKSFLIPRYCPFCGEKYVKEQPNA